MLGLSLWKIVIIGGVFAVLFGRGRVSELMGDVGKALKSFKRGLADDEGSQPALVPVRIPVSTDRDRS